MFDDKERHRQRLYRRRLDKKEFMEKRTTEYLPKVIPSKHRERKISPREIDFIIEKELEDE